MPCWIDRAATGVVPCPQELPPVLTGDWAFHCHLRHHPMNSMGHEIPLMTGVDQAGLEKRIQALLPGYMPMGRYGMGR